MSFATEETNFFPAQQFFPSLLSDSFLQFYWYKDTMWWLLACSFLVFVNRDFEIFISVFLLHVLSNLYGLPCFYNMRWSSFFETTGWEPKRFARKSSVLKDASQPPAKQLYADCPLKIPKRFQHSLQNNLLILPPLLKSACSWKAWFELCTSFFVNFCDSLIDIFSRWAIQGNGSKKAEGNIIISWFALDEEDRSTI